MGTIRKLDQTADKFSNRTQSTDKDNRKARRSAIAKTRKTTTRKQAIVLGMALDVTEGEDT